MKLTTPLAALLFACAAQVSMTGAVHAQKLHKDALRIMRCPNDGVQPQAEMALDGVLHLVYFKGLPGGGNLEYVHSSDDGKTFSDPIRVNSADNSVDARRLTRGARMFYFEGGRVHVTWVGMPREFDGLDEPTAPAMYSRSNPERTSFEPERVLSSGLHGLDAAPSVVETSSRVIVAWQALADETDRTKRVDTDEKHAFTSPIRIVYIARSKDGGKTFDAQESQRMSADSSASRGCSVAIGSPKKGEFNILVRSSTWRGKDLRNLVSTDNGATFRPLFMDDWRVKRRVWENLILTLGPPPETRGPRLLVGAWERDGRVWWLLVENEPEIKNIQLAPRERDVWQCRPNVATSDRGATVLVWVEGDDRKSLNRIGWHGWATKGHAVIGSGKFRDIPADAVPDIFLSADSKVFHVIY